MLVYCTVSDYGAGVLFFSNIQTHTRNSGEKGFGMILLD